MRRTQRAVVGITGIAATVLLHVLLLTMAIWGEGHWALNPKLPDAIGAGANSGRPDGEIGERRILVMLSPEFQEAVPPPESEPHLAEPALPSILEITGANELPLPPIADIPGEEAEASDAELMARAKYAGIYESQVRARIERAWEMTRESTPRQDFSCVAEILQQRDGRVREVVLARCDDSLAWQQSLVSAIQRASPLPAPPIPGAFVDRFSLMFQSKAQDQSGQLVKR